MERIFLFQIDVKSSDFIKKIASQMHIKVVEVAENLCNNTLGDIVNGKAKEDLNARFYKGSLLLFDGVSEKHFDRILHELKVNSIITDYKAVLTPTNAGWTLGRLYLELAREKMSYSLHD